MLNTNLGRKPHECLEYIAVHEMIHILEPTPTSDSVGMSRHVPDWKHRRQVLNRQPVQHENRAY